MCRTGSSGPSSTSLHMPFGHWQTLWGLSAAPPTSSGCSTTTFWAFPRLLHSPAYRGAACCGAAHPLRPRQPQPWEWGNCEGNSELSPSDSLVLSAGGWLGAGPPPVLDWDEGPLPQLSVSPPNRAWLAVFRHCCVWRHLLLTGWGRWAASELSVCGGRGAIGTPSRRSVGVGRQVPAGGEWGVIRREGAGIPKAPSLGEAHDAGSW